MHSMLYGHIFDYTNQDEKCQLFCREVMTVKCRTYIKYKVLTLWKN